MKGTAKSKVLKVSRTVRIEVYSWFDEIDGKTKWETDFIRQDKTSTHETHDSKEVAMEYAMLWAGIFKVQVLEV